MTDAPGVEAIRARIAYLNSPDYVAREVTAALVAHDWSDPDGTAARDHVSTAHAAHTFDRRCALCAGDAAAVVAFVVARTEVTSRVLVASRDAALARLHGLHFARPHALGDFVAHGQTDFPDLCDHCRSPYPCATVTAVGVPHAPGS